MTDTAPLLQLQLAGLSLLCGAAAGFVYDLFALLRSGRPLLAPLLDLLFCLAAGAALFCLGAGPGGGQLRLYMLLFLLLGMWLYFTLSGGRLRRLLGRLLGFICQILGLLTAPLRCFLHFLQKTVKKALKFEKKLFQNSARWYTLYNKFGESSLSRRNLKKGTGRSDEAEEDWADYQNRYSDPGSLRDRVTYEYPWPY